MGRRTKEQESNLVIWSCEEIISKKNLSVVVFIVQNVILFKRIYMYSATATEVCMYLLPRNHSTTHQRHIFVDTLW